MESCSQIIFSGTRWPPISVPVNRRALVIGAGMGSWTSPRGGYFLSFDALPGLATGIVKLAADAGVKLTPAGATFPYRRDPDDANIRLAPTFPEVAELDQAMQVFVVCVQLASVRRRLGS